MTRTKLSHRILNKFGACLAGEIETRLLGAAKACSISGKTAASSMVAAIALAVRRFDAAK